MIRGPEDTLIWTDIETTGLDLRYDDVIEIAFVVTDGSLNVIGESPSWVMRPSMFPKVGSVVYDMHMASGLLTEALTSAWDSSDEHLPAFAVENETPSISLEILQWLRQFGEPEQHPLCGSSVHFDRAFLKKHYPRVEEWFFRRNIDVSSLKELYKRWDPEFVAAAPEGQKKHRSLPDIYDSIAELRYYMARMRT